MSVRIRGRDVLEVQLRIYEPPRFFEGILKGRSYTEVPDITARICGICPVAYQTSGALAIEQACGVTVDGPIRELRRLLYCGEWIESHALHLYLLHAPDFLGYESAIHMAADHPALVERGLATRKAGNQAADHARRPSRASDQPTDRGVLSRPQPGRIDAARRAAAARARGHTRDDRAHRHAHDARVRARLRVCRTSGRRRALPDRPRADRFKQRSRHCGRSL